MSNGNVRCSFVLLTRPEHVKRKLELRYCTPIVEVCIFNSISPIFGTLRAKTIVRDDTRCKVPPGPEQRAYNA